MTTTAVESVRTLTPPGRGLRAACSIRRCSGSPSRRYPQMDPRTLWRNPVMLIVEIGSGVGHRPGGDKPELVRLADRVLALADSHFRQSGRGGGRGPRKGSRPKLFGKLRPIPPPAAWSVGRQVPRHRGRGGPLCCPRATSSSPKLVKSFPRRRRRRRRHCLR